MDISRFRHGDFLPALKALFTDLNIPISYVSDEPVSAKTVLENTWKDNAAFHLIQDVYFPGMVDDAAFAGNKSIDISEIKSDYDGILIFGISLHERENGRLPSRSHLAEITRAFNREYFYTPVIAVFHYSGYLAFASTERLKYRQEWREGEKTGKVSLLRDIDIKNPHAGHIRIINDLKIPVSGKNRVDSFASLYAYWQNVFNVSILNKKFYQELSNWYFWAIKASAFPSAPSENDAQQKKTDPAARRQEHNAKNIIRLLTRLLFVWFIKEKNLIPDALFDPRFLKDELLKGFNPDHGEKNVSSVYYKAVLQNLFFASLNCPIEPSEDGDRRRRAFRLKKNFGQHRDANFLMRYRDAFKDPEKFVALVNAYVPFLNGGLFECLDNKTDKIYIDGFSDNLVKPHQLTVPDFLFFGPAREADLSTVVGIKTKAYKKAGVKGLIPILESYKFTIAENTPVEEDLALDPELLGRVFENLLASYNPETKTSARKQTGSFYTPREIVNYMVDESLTVYLKNSVKNWGIAAEQLDKNLRDLLSYDAVSPFAEDEDRQKKIIRALDRCRILDPACGSGAFPMGILQKMVHILQKLDPDNEHWKQLQKEKALKETEGAFAIADKKEREQKLIEINEAFDENINAPDYARKLFLIENCIFGADIQEIAVQISKLRFFISLVLDQKADKEKPNFGIRALPNLETRFVAANTLIGIEKPEKQMGLFDDREIEALEKELKNIRHRLFSAKSPASKRKLREKDKELREKIGNLLIKQGWGNKTAKQLAAWDPYDQNASSPFFDSEWMFGVSNGFDVVIGNPPYVQLQKFSGQQCQKDWEAQNYKTFVKTGDIYSLFYEKGNMLLKDRGVLVFITSNKWMRANYGRSTRKYLLENVRIHQVIDFGDSPIFENATTYTNIMIFSREQPVNQIQAWDLSKEYKSDRALENMLQDNVFCESIFNEDSFVIIPTEQSAIKKRIEEIGIPLKDWNISIYRGVLTGYNEAFIISGKKKDELIAKDSKSAEIIKPILRGRDIKRYRADFADLWLIYSYQGIDKNRYPIIIDYLKQHKEILLKRTGGARRDKSGKIVNIPYDWNELQVDYYRSGTYKEFEKEKIIYAEIVFDSAFHFDTDGYYPEATVFIMTGKNLKYLTALLNSKIITYAFKTFYAGGDLRGNTFRYKKAFLNNLPIPQISEKARQPFIALVEKILSAKKQNPKAD
ncbi:MAG: N-6 DNA methylase, partial [Desulfococcaceae bacterium]|nr:N-6 DNA methylase [Desulfococcaceae bacterium]